ncbi:MAG: hypothetical protein VW455_07765 [Nitrospinota bacterium]
MYKNKSNLIKAGLNIVFVVSVVTFSFSCASVNSGGGAIAPGTALSHVQPIINEGECGEGKGIYRKIKNSHSSKEIVVTIKTDLSPDPNNWYPSERDFTLKPDQQRILACSIVDEGPGKEDSRVSHSILGAKFK